MRGSSVNMRSSGIVFFGLLLLAGCAASPQTPLSVHTSNTHHMQISSPAFADHTRMPSQYTCNGADINPPLTFTDVPENAVSLALIMDDPDVPKDLRADGMWDHWIVFNIPPETRAISENTEPEGVHGTGTSGNTDYYGPCPPDREHRYFFTLYALDTMLALPEGSSKTSVEAALKGHIIDQAALVGLYEQK